jgi:NADH-quinone oxidoreductase subunit J
MNYQLLFFYIFAFITLFSSMMVILARSAVHSALYLIIALFAVAGVFVVLDAEFLAAVQVLVYAGGIMILFLFVIMLVSLRQPLGKIGRFRKYHIGISIMLVLILSCLLISIFSMNPNLSKSPENASILKAEGGNLEAVGIGLYRYYVLPFEVASVLLLVAMIGAVVFAKYRI